MRPSAFERLYLAPESTEGTPVLTTKVLQGLDWRPAPDIPREPIEVSGYSIPVGMVTMKESCGGELSGVLAVNELAYLLASCLETPAITTPGTNGTFTVDLDSPSAGTFTLTFGGQTTAALAYTITAAALQTALEGLSSIGTGNVLVSGGPGETAAFGVRFRAALERTALMLTGNFVGLTDGAAAAIATTAATNTRRWTYTPSATAPNTVTALTLAGGSSDSAVSGARVAGCKVTDLSINLRPRATSELTATHIGRVYESGYRVQNLFLSGSPAGGTFTISFGGQTTGNIAYNATAAVVQAALEALSNVEPGDVLVVGSAGSPWMVSFPANGPTWGTADVPAMTTNGASLTGGTNPAVLVSNCVTNLSVTEIAHKPIAPPSIDIYVGSTILGLAKLDAENCLQASLSIPSKHAGVYTLNSDDPSYSGTVEQGGQPKSSLTVEANTATDGYINRLRAGDKRYCRIVATGGSIETGFVYRIQLTFAFQFASLAPEQVDGLECRTSDLQVVYDATLGSTIEAVIDTALTAL